MTKEEREIIDEVNNMTLQECMHFIKSDIPDYPYYANKRQIITQNIQKLTAELLSQSKVDIEIPKLSFRVKTAEESSLIKAAQESAERTKDWPEWKKNCLGNLNDKV